MKVEIGQDRVMLLEGALEGADARGRVAPEATAYAAGEAECSFHVLAGWSEVSEDAEVIDWMSGLHETLAPHGMDAAYINLLGDGEEDRMGTARLPGSITS